MRQADVVLYLFDVNEVGAEELKSVAGKMQQEEIHFLLVGNKVDVLEESVIREKLSGISGIIFISAKSNRHIEVLKERMIDMVLQEHIQGEDVVVTNARHFHALQKLSTSLIEVEEGLHNKLPGDLLAIDIRRCLQYLGEITGEVTNDDQLDYIFSKFCIGK